MEQLFHQLKPSGTMRLVRKGANVLFQGEIPRHAIIVRDGVVRAYTITSSGEERIVALYSKGDILPLTWILGETTNTLFYYDALTDARLMTVSKNTLMSAIKDNPEFLASMLRFVGNQYTALLMRVSSLEQSRAIEKIGFTLYYLLFRYGVEKKPGQYVIEIKISQVMLAGFVGLSRESTTKNLKILKEKGILSHEKSIYLIDKVKLEHFLGEDGFRDLTI